MNGMLAMLRKEALEIRYTSRKWVFPAIVLFYAVLAAVITYYLPHLSSTKIAQPTVVDACAQFIGFLSGLAIIGVIATTASVVSSEVRNGTAVLVVTKPVSRTAFVLAKIISQSAIVIVAELLATGVFAALAAALFHSLPVGHLLAGVGISMVLALLFTVAMVLVSCRINSQPAALGIGLGLYALLTLLGIWQPLKDNSPAGIVTAATNALHGTGGAWLWPLVTSFVLIVALVPMSGRVFAHREI